MKWTYFLIHDTTALEGPSQLSDEDICTYIVDSYLHLIESIENMEWT